MTDPSVLLTTHAGVLEMVGYMPAAAKKFLLVCCAVGSNVATSLANPTPPILADKTSQSPRWRVRSATYLARAVQTAPAAYSGMLKQSSFVPQYPMPPQMGGKNKKKAWREYRQPM